MRTEPDFATLRGEMVERQLRHRGIDDERVLSAMAAVPRELFVPAGLRRRAYADSALPIGEGQTISQPWIVAAICQALRLEGSDGPDVLIGDNGPNSMMGHLGADTFIGKGGGDTIDAIDGRRDQAIVCGGGADDVSKDRSDPSPSSC